MKTFNKKKKKIIEKTGADLLKEEVITSPGKVIFLNFISKKLVRIGLVMFLAVFSFVFVLGPIINYDPYTNEMLYTYSRPGRNYLKIDKQVQGKDIIDIQSGLTFTVALDAEGKLYYWGQDEYGINNKIKELSESPKTFGMVRAGNKHILALSKNGDLEIFGYNQHNQAEIPVEIRSKIQAEGILDFDGGADFSMVVTKKNNLIVWGSVDATNIDRVPSNFNGRVAKAYATHTNIIVIFTDGTVGVMGTRGSELYVVPEHLTDGSVNVVDIVASQRAAMALDDQGNVYTWGSSEYRLLVIPEYTGKVRSIASTYYSFSITTTTGEQHLWGSNRYGLSTQPKVVSEDSEKVFGNFFQFYSISSEGTITGWGFKGFLLGADVYGRDVFSRLVSGGRVTLTIGLVAVLISTLIGVIVGMIAGFYGKWLDNLLMRLAEIINAVPFMPLAITLSSIVATKMNDNERMLMIMIVLGVLGWTGLARIVRGQILSEREKDFVLAAKSLGLKESAIILKHILPNIVNLVIVDMTISYAAFLLTESGLSFLGFGVNEPLPSWGNMLTAAQSSIVIRRYWWLWTLPAILVTLTALSVNLIGDGLRDAMDPRSNEK